MAIRSGVSRNQQHSNAHVSNAQRQRELRQAAIAELMLSGITRPGELARKLGIGRTTLQRDLDVVQAQFRERSATLIAEAKGIQYDRLEIAIAAIWPKVLKGHHASIQALVALLQRQARLLGLDAPQAVTLNWGEALAEAGVDRQALYHDIVQMLVASMRPKAALPPPPELDLSSFEPVPFDDLSDDPPPDSPP